MAAPKTRPRAPFIGERLWAALLFLLVPVAVPAMLLGGLTQALACRRRPFLAVAALQAACAGTVALLLLGGWCAWVAATMGGVAGLMNEVSVIHSRYITHEPIYLLPEDLVAINVLVVVSRILWVLAFAGAVTALFGRVLSVPLPPAWLRRWTAITW